MHPSGKLLASVMFIAGPALSIQANTGRGTGATELTYQGQAKAIVVIAENPTRPAHVAAKEFIHYIKQISGVELPLYVDGAAPKKEWAPRRVLIGESSLTREYGLRNADFQPQEYLIETRGTDLILMGSDAEEYGIISYEENGAWPTAARRSPLFTAMGSLYAVDTFLEKYCGVRWYLPGDIGEVCPTQPTLRFQNVYLRTKPWTVHRWSSRLGHPDPFQFYEGQPDYRAKAVSARDDLLFQLRMKIGGEPYVCNHSFYSYYHRFGKTHPEWWADRKPDPHLHLDYLSPRVIRQAAQDGIDYFSGKYPDHKYPDGSPIVASGDYFSVMPLDRSDKWVMTPAAKKLFRPPHPVDPDVPLSGWAADWASEYYFTVVNRVAKLIRRKFPDKWITASAYAAFFRPPKTVRLEPNVSIQVCDFITTTFHKPT